MTSRVARVETAPALKNGHRFYVTVVVDQNGNGDIVSGSERDVKNDAHAETRAVSRLLRVPMGESAKTYTLA